MVKKGENTRLDMHFVLKVQQNVRKVQKILLIKV